MADRERGHGGELLRSLVAALEHAAAQAAAVPARSAAEGAVHGAAEELRAELPELERELKGIIRDSLSVIARLTRDAAERPGVMRGDWAEGVAQGVVRGAFDQFRDSMPVLDATATALIGRLNELVERSAVAAEARAQESFRPGDRARLAAAGAIQGALSQLRDSLPELGEQLRGLGPLGEYVASSAGRGLVEGVMSRTDELSAALDLLVDRVARSLIHAGVRELEDDAAAHPALRPERVGSVLADIAEQAAASAIRGVAAELRDQLRGLHGSGATASVARELTREVFEGAFDAIAARLRRPGVRRFAAVAAVLATGVFAARLRAR